MKNVICCTCLYIKNYHVKTITSCHSTMDTCGETKVSEQWRSTIIESGEEIRTYIFTWDAKLGDDHKTNPEIMKTANMRLIPTKEEIAEILKGYIDTDKYMADKLMINGELEDMIDEWMDVYFSNKKYYVYDIVEFIDRMIFDEGLTFDDVVEKEYHSLDIYDKEIPDVKRRLQSGYIYYCNDGYENDPEMSFHKFIGNYWLCHTCK